MNTSLWQAGSQTTGGIVCKAMSQHDVRIFIHSQNISILLLLLSKLNVLSPFTVIIDEKCTYIHIRTI